MTEADGVVPLTNAIHSSEVDFLKALNYSNLKGKTILITGGASGLGAGFFKSWAAHGATIIIGDLNESAGQALVKEVSSKTKNKNLHFLKLDVTDWQSQVAFFHEACKLSPHGGIDCVIANAGVGGMPESNAFENPPDYRSMENPPPPKFTTLDINVTGVMYTITLATSYLPRNPGSQKCSTDISSNPRDRHLILISSIAGLSGVPSLSIYCASKHAVVGLFRSLRVTTPIVHGIRVNMINPYFTITPILGALGAVAMAGAGVSEVEDVVAAATRLVTDQSIAGRALIIGPKSSPSAARAAAVDLLKSEEGQGAVWDAYAHDFEQSDVFVRRVVALTNLKAGRKGWTGLIGDLCSALISPARRLLGF